MKKIALLSFALFLGTALFAQTKKSTVKTGTKRAPAPVVHTGQCYADKTWKLMKIEKFAVTNDPGPDQKNDMLRLNGDGTFKVILKGVEKSGTYTKSGSWLNLKPSDGSEAMPYKIEACEGSELKADWRDGDTHNHFTYKAE